MRRAVPAAHAVAPPSAARVWRIVQPVGCGRPRAWAASSITAQATASKAGLIGLAHNLAAALAPLGVIRQRVTPDACIATAAAMTPGWPRPAERPVGRFGQPAEVADPSCRFGTAYLTRSPSPGGGRYPR